VNMTNVATAATMMKRRITRGLVKELIDYR
jgi:hypothetical protein